MAFSARAKPKAAPPPAAVQQTKDEDSDEVESVGAAEDAAARKKEVEDEAKRAREAAEAKEKERKAAEDAARQKAATEAARRREAAEEARRKAEEDKRRREEYEYEKARQETIARSKKEAARRAGGGGFGGGGFGGGGGGGGGGSFAWKKSSPAQAAGSGASGAPGKDASKRADMPSHDECEMGISAMISRTNNGMKEGLQMLGLPNFPLTFIPGQALVLCGHDVREGINEMIHNWMTDEKDDFFGCLQQLRDITSKPILTQDEMEMMDNQEDWVQIDGPDGKPRFTKRDAAAKKEAPVAPKPAIAPQPEDDDSGDEVIDIVPGGPIPTSTQAAPPPAPAPVRAAPPVAAAPVPTPGADDDFYGLLGVAADASLQEIRTKFRSLVVTEHPEKGGDPKKFQKLNKAYSVLSDQKKRQEYDASRGGAAARPKKFVD